MATMTVSAARRVLGRRIGPWAALADLDDAMARSARLAGLSPASVSRLVDDDLSTLDDFDAFLDVAELRAWESILGNATDTGLRDVGLDDDPRTVREAAKEAMDRLSKYTKSVYGIGLATISTGTIGLDFQAGADDDTSSDY